MANDLNKVCVIGNLTRDMELSYLQNNTAKGNLSIAVNRCKKSADGQRVEEASFFDVLIWGQTAQNLQQYLTKGKKIAVSGYLKQDRWQDQQTGQNRSRIYIVAEDVQLLGGAQNGQQSTGYNQQPVQQSTAYNPSAVQQPQQYQQRPQQTYQQNVPQNNGQYQQMPQQSVPQNQPQQNQQIPQNQPQYPQQNQPMQGNFPPLNDGGFPEDVPW